MLDAIWALGECTVRELLERQSSVMAYTTVMTTLDRLYHKQLLTRTVEGRAFCYKPRFTREEMHRAEAENAIRELLRSPAGPALPLSYLVEAIPSMTRSYWMNCRGRSRESSPNWANEEKTSPADCATDVGVHYR